MRLRRFIHALFALVFIIPILVLCAPPPATAQIEVADDGSVTVGEAPFQTSTNGSIGIGPVGKIWRSTKLHVDREAAADYPIAIGAKFNARYGTDKTRGVVAHASNGSGSGIGVQASASDSEYNYGIRAKASGGTQSYAGYFTGDVHITGELSGASDRKLKKDIRGLGDALPGNLQARMVGFAEATLGALTDAGAGRSQARAKLLQLEPKRFAFRRSEYAGMGLPEGEQYGLVAQQVQQVLPGLVEEVRRPGTLRRDDEGRVVGQTEAVTYLSVNYQELVPVLIQTAREQQAELDALREQVEMLKAALQAQGIDVE